jgi:hypothetical protein
MYKKTMIAGAILAAAVQGPTATVAQLACEVQEVPPVCQDADRININSNSRNISPRNICVNPGASISVKVTPAGSSVTIAPKNEAEWLHGSGETFTLQVPASATGEFDYNVYFADDTCIDPRIKVR